MNELGFERNHRLFLVKKKYTLQIAFIIFFESMSTLNEHVITPE